MSALTQIEQALANVMHQLPQQLGTLAVNFAKQRFVDQAWQNTSSEPWQPRRNNRRGGTARQKGAVLVDSGRLKRSIRIISVSPTAVIIGTDVPYAQIHNDGFEGDVNVKAYTQQVKGHKRKQKVKSKKGKKTKIVNVRPHSRHVKAHTRSVNMPRRRFLGESAELERQITEFILGEIQSAI